MDAIEVDTALLSELEREIEEGLHQAFNYVGVGSALAVVRDSGAYKANYPKWADYLREKWDIHRATANDYIRAAAVAGDVDPVVLPLVHAALLYRFDADTRRKVAALIRDKSKREATLIVLDMVEQKRRRASQADEDRNPELEQLDEIVKASQSLNLPAAKRAVERLRKQDRLKLQRALSRVASKMSDLS